MFVIFFFQAEDGIRDHCVTGVQTCALPIWGSDRGGGAPRRPGSMPARAVLRTILPRRAEPPMVRHGRAGPGRTDSDSRSEERRVGKECRDRVTPDSDIINKDETIPQHSQPE